MITLLLKKLGLGILYIPVIILVVFTFDEVFSGDLSGFSHLLQMIPFLILIFFAMKKPLIAGIALSAFGLILGGAYLINGFSNISSVIFVESVLFVPPLISGVLLILSSRK